MGTITRIHAKLNKLMKYHCSELFCKLNDAKLNKSLFYKQRKDYSYCCTSMTATGKTEIKNKIISKCWNPQYDLFD